MCLTDVEKILRRRKYDILFKILIYFTLVLKNRCVTNLRWKIKIRLTVLRDRYATVHSERVHIVYFVESSTGFEDDQSFGLN